MIILEYLTIPYPPYSVLRISRFVKTRPTVLRSKAHPSLCRPFNLAVTKFYGGREGSTRAIPTILDLPNKSPDCTETPRSIVFRGTLSVRSAKSGSVHGRRFFLRLSHIACLRT